MKGETMDTPIFAIHSVETVCAESRQIGPAAGTLEIVLNGFVTFPITVHMRDPALAARIARAINSAMAEHQAGEPASLPRQSFLPVAVGCLPAEHGQNARLIETARERQGQEEKVS